jgi:hypothetical protein
MGENERVRGGAATDEVLRDVHGEVSLDPDHAPVQQLVVE